MAHSGPEVCTTGSKAGRSILVWDGVVRWSHWVLAALVLVELVRDDGDRLHRGLGYLAVGIVAGRLLWGLRSGSMGSLQAMRPSIPAAWRYLLQLRHGHAPRHLGHNPLGTWMVWLLWSLVLLLALTGWMSRLDALWGEDWPVELHAALAHVMMICIGLHWAGVALASWHQREDLVAAMFTGRKRAPDRDDGDVPRPTD